MLMICMLLTRCGSENVICEVYGPEHEYISFCDETFTECNESAYVYLLK